MAQIESSTKPSYTLLDSLKFISALSIISIHTQPFMGHQDSWLYLPYLFMQCFAIPFFFVSSSYLFFCKFIQENKTSGIESYTMRWLKRTVCIYLLYSAINAFVDITNVIHYTPVLWFRFIFLGEGNGYLWFFAALITSVMLLRFLVGLRPSKQWAVSITIATVIISGIVMFVLQFYNGIFKTGIVADLSSWYYSIFNNTRNFVSGIYYCGLGLLAVQIKPVLGKKYLTVLIGGGIIASFIEMMFVHHQSLWRESYSSFLLSIVLIFVMVGCVSYSVQIKNSLCMRKASNIIYYQHRYVIIAYAVLGKILGVDILGMNVLSFLLVALTMCLLTILYVKLENTSLKRVLKYMY